MFALVNVQPTGLYGHDSIPFKPKRKAPKRVLFVLVDSKGIEPSNLTDANRALSQLSYKPVFTFRTILATAECIIPQIFRL